MVVGALATWFEVAEEEQVPMNEEVLPNWLEGEMRGVVESRICEHLSQLYSIAMRNLRLAARRP